MKYAMKYQPYHATDIQKATLKSLDSVVSELLQVNQLPELDLIVQKFSQKFGFKAIGHLSILGQEAKENISWSEKEQVMQDFTSAYLETQAYLIDPVSFQGRQNISAIPWGLSFHRAHLSKEEKFLYGLLDSFDLNRGLLMPLHGPVAFSVLGVTSLEQEVDFCSHLPELIPIVQVFAGFLHETITRIHGTKPTLSILTPREIECLHWAAAGKTAVQISEILSISEHTTIFHIENAKHKLESKTLPQAVARAVSYGLIKP